ncbi:MAG: hypothetical protein P4M05_22775 [Bradyrhizobium sp.]|nr:hypothetical protein [Bradyrhizobium sp.]
MRRLGCLLPVFVAVWIGLLPTGPSFATDANLKTPEGAVAAYVDGVARQDFKAIVAVTPVDNMSKGFDFVFSVSRLGALSPTAPVPSSHPLFVEINKATFMAQIGQQVRILTYGLMTTSKILDGKYDVMDADGAAEFARVVRADRLAGLSLVKVGIPDPAALNNERNQANATKLAKTYGADASTQRLALLSFEGLQFVVGFTLLRYGDDWTVMSQTSSVAAGTDSLGVPRRVTLEAFEEMLK